MILLTDTTETLELTTSSADSTDYAVGYADHTTSNFTPGSSQGNVAAATTTVIATAPAGSAARQIKSISIVNKGAGSQTVTVKKDVSAVEYTLVKVTLATQETLQYIDGHGWYSLDTAGAIKGAGSPGADGVDGAGTVLGTGTSIVDFGAGASDAELIVTGEAAITAGSLVTVWLKHEATTDHSADEHLVETIKVFAKDVVAGTGFTIHAFNTNQVTEPDIPPGSYLGRYSGVGASQGQGQRPRNHNVNKSGGKVPFINGKWSIGWMYTQ